MPIYRCYGCQSQFESAKAVCACGVDPAAYPRDKGMIVELTTIHFDPPGRRPGVGLGYAACDPKLNVGRTGCQFTGETGAVTCPRCKASEAFTSAEGGGPGVSEGMASRPVAPLPKGGK